MPSGDPDSKLEYGDRMVPRAGTDSPPEPARHANELSAPYEVPQFPIEQIESKLLQAKEGLSKGPESDQGAVADIEDEIFVPHFQRITTTGDDCSGVPIEDLKSASEMLVKALDIRKRYMKYSLQ